MTSIHIRRIKAVFNEFFSSVIDTSDAKSERDQENYFFTRSQAAYAISHLADVDHQAAADSIVDGYDDNGIDAIYFDRSTKSFYLVQSKWDENGTKSPELGAINKFLAGIEDILHGRLDKFNSKVLKKQTDILEALDSIQVRFVIVVVYTGNQGLSLHVQRALDEFIERQNESFDFMYLKVYNQQLLLKAISGAIAGDPINLDVIVHDWGEVSEPYKAIYGQVSASDIASWYQEYDTRLLARNLRTFKGDTEVNQGIKNTLSTDAHNFWYFNNGITVLCGSIEKAARYGNNRKIGIFTCKGVSVVNGAQTVGSIAEVERLGFKNIENARVLVRLISLENCPPGFGSQVTTATNTQNQVYPRDFAALDANQERLKSELWYDLQKTYLYRGESNIYPDKGCTIEEAAVALACLSGDVALAVQAKREISKLFEDINDEPYTLLFNNKLTAIKMWNAVQVSRSVESFLIQAKQELVGPKRLVAIHGNRFILYRVFLAINSADLQNSDSDIETYIVKSIEYAATYLEAVSTLIEKEFNGIYINGLFKNRSKCQTLDKLLPKELNTQIHSGELAKQQQLSFDDL